MCHLQKYPTPISIAYNEFIHSEHIQMQLRSGIKAFSVVLKYCSLLIISDYLRLRKADVFKRANIDKLFIEDIERPSLGQWNGFLREILKEFADEKELLFVPELYDFYYRSSGGKKPEQHKTVKVIDELINIRNIYVHPDIYPPDQEAETLCREIKEKLDYLLEQLSFVIKYPLIKYLHKEEIEEECIGLMSSLSRHEQKISFYIRSTDEERKKDKLELGSFIYSFSKDLDEKHPVLLYETLMRKKLKYILCNYYIITEGNKTNDYHPVEEMRAVINRLSAEMDKGIRGEIEKNINDLGKDISNGIIKWDTIQKLSKMISDDTYNRFIKEGKFSLELYVERKEINNEIESFLSSSKRCFVLVAESGLGKTNLFCKWERKLLKEGNSVLLFYGREYDGLDLGELCLNHLYLKGVNFEENIFKGNFYELLELLSRTNEVKSQEKKLIVLYDAVNEYDHPERLLDNIIDFANKVTYPWVKIIFSIRTFVWEHFYYKYPFDKGIFYYSEKEKGKQLPFLMLEKFSGDELKEAYNHYKSRYKLQSTYEELSRSTRKLLSNPLLLRFASEAYENKSFPKEVFTSKIFEQYQKERINKNDHIFLSYLAEALWILKNDDILFNQISNKMSPTSNRTVSQAIKKLEEYVYEDPVYESIYVPTCDNLHCKNFNKELLTGHLNIDENVAESSNNFNALSFQNKDTNETETINECENCGMPLKTSFRDLRTTYVRLQSENILQEFSKEGDGAIRFTYDRMFEYMLSNYLSNKIFREFTTKGGSLLYSIIKEVRSNHIFWGAIKNVLLTYLRDDTISLKFWKEVITYEFLSYENDVTELETGLAYKQIISSTIIDLYHENQDNAINILLFITDKQNESFTSLDITLKCLTQIIDEFGYLSGNSIELELIRRGQNFSNKYIRVETARIISQLYKINKSLTVKIIGRLKNDILGQLKLINLIGFLNSKKRIPLVNKIDSFSQILLNILGPHYSDEFTRQEMLKFCGELLNNQFYIVIRFFIKHFIPKKLAGIYWENTNPCNYIEMHYSLNSDYKDCIKLIGKLFINVEKLRLLDYEEKLFNYAQIENGLLSWYLYSLIPIYGQLNHQTDEVIEFLERLFNDGNHISKYIAQKSFWILAEFSDLKSDLIDDLFQKYSIKLIQQYGGKIIYHHISNETDRIASAFISEKNKKGSNTVFEADYNGHNISLIYDNTALLDYTKYLMLKKDVSKYDFLIELLDNQFKEDDQFLAYAINSICQVGTLENPGPTLKTYEHIIENKSNLKKEISYQGKLTSIQELIEEALLKIKCFYPKQVIFFVESLENNFQKQFSSVIVKDVEKRFDYLDSYYGELIYQKTFLIEKKARNIFGAGILASINVNSVEKIFKSYVNVFTNWFNTIKNKL